LDSSPEREPALKLRSGSAKDIQTGISSAPLDRGKKPSLADPRRTDDQHEARAAARNRSDQRVHSG
jgi:hypothetical protein